MKNAMEIHHGEQYLYGSGCFHFAASVHGWKAWKTVRCINTNINFVFEFSGTTLMKNKFLGTGFFKGRGNEQEDHLLLLFWCCYLSSVFYTYKACRGLGVGRMSCGFFFCLFVFYLKYFFILWSSQSHPSCLNPFC